MGKLDLAFGKQHDAVSEAEVILDTLTNDYGLFDRRFVVSV